MAKLKDLRNKIGQIQAGKEGIDELEQIFTLVNNEKYLKYDPTIARGLSYYTGPVYEVNVIEGGVGSVAGGGRYDKLIGSFMGQEVPAVGISFGIERIITVMMERNMKLATNEDQELTMVAVMERYEKEAFSLAETLRQKGERVLLYPEVKKLGKQFEYADKKGVSKVYVLGENEVKEGKVLVKDMKTGDQQTLTVEELVNKLK